MKKVLAILLAAILCAATLAVTASAAQADGKKTIVVALSNSETSPEAVCFKVIEDYVNEKTDGAFEFKYFYNGALCSQKEETDYLQSGDIDFHANLVAQNPEKAILRQAFGNVLGVDNVNDFFNTVCFSDTEAAKLIEEECAEHNSKLLGVWNSGANLFFATKPIASFDDLRGTQYGADMGLAAIEAMGISCQQVTVLDLYESLSRGVINSSSLPLAGVVVFKLYEVAPYGLYLNAAAPSHHLEMNLDTWNSLSEEEQQYFVEGIRLSEEKYLELLHEQEEGVLSAFTEMNYTSDEDTMEYIKAYYQEQWKAYKGMAEAAGKLDDFRTVMQAVVDAAGVEITMD